jgi:hypothetical protein
MLVRAPALALSAAVLCSAAPAGAQCASFTGEFAQHGFDTEVSDSIVFDDGTGPALYVVGHFTEVAGQPALRIARWDGASWSAVGGGLSGYAETMAVFDDGSGSALYVGGKFATAGAVSAPNVARWDGTSWTGVTTGLSGGAVVAQALAVFDDGSGPALFLGGDFTGVSGVPAANLARWDGTDWTEVAGGADDEVESLLTLDLGGGPALYASGNYSEIGGALTQSVARYDGTSWTPLVGGPVMSWAGPLGAFDTGSGNALVASGYLDGSFSNAMWDGTTWSAMASPPAQTLWIFDYRTFGSINYAATVYGLYSWSGSVWVPEQTTFESGDDALTLTLFDEGGGERLFVGGDFEQLGAKTLNHIARFDGSGLTALGPLGNATDGYVSSFVSGTVAGVGASLYAGGEFTGAGLSTSDQVARWDGTQWLDVGTGVGGWSPVTVRALGIYDDGSGSALYAGGWFNAAGTLPMLNMARWDGISGWSTIGDLTFGPVQAMTLFDDGGGLGLYVGGKFRFAGGVAVNGVARYDGSWSALGAGLAGGKKDAHALCVFDDGSGPALFVGGDFTDADGVTVSGIARWDGASWQDVGGGVAGGNPGPLASPFVVGVQALAVFDDGAGPALYAGGNFTSAGGAPAGHLARWDGATWSALPSGDVDARVYSLAVHDDRSGGGPWLYVGGEFDDISGLAASKLARWNADGWSTVDGGTDGAVRALAEHGGDLYAGGDFVNAGAQPSHHVARLANPCECQATSYCTAGTTSNGCNATISSVGKASVSAASGFDLLVSDLEGAKQGLIYFGTEGAKATPWGGGSTSFACVRGPHQRTMTQSSGGTSGQCDGSFALDFNAWMTANPGKAPAAGQTTWLQAWFRDPPAPKTTAFSDAVLFSVCP